MGIKQDQDWAGKFPREQWVFLAGLQRVDIAVIFNVET